MVAREAAVDVRRDARQHPMVFLWRVRVAVAIAVAVAMLVTVAMAVLSHSVAPHSEEGHDDANDEIVAQLLRQPHGAAAFRAWHPAAGPLLLGRGLLHGRWHWSRHWRCQLSCTRHRCRLRDRRWWSAGT